MLLVILTNIDSWASKEQEAQDAKFWEFSIRDWWCDPGHRPRRIRTPKHEPLPSLSSRLLQYLLQLPTWETIVIVKNVISLYRHYKIYSIQACPCQWTFIQSLWGETHRIRWWWDCPESQSVSSKENRWSSFESHRKLGWVGGNLNIQELGSLQPRRGILPYGLSVCQTSTVLRRIDVVQETKTLLVAILNHR
jgi:hypothetical protein